MAVPTIKHVTDGWHDFGQFVVCAHWVEFDAPIVDGAAQPVQLHMPDGTVRQGVADVDAHGRPVPTRLRSYVGLVIEQPAGAQVQVKGRLRTGGDRLAIQIDDFPG